MPEQTGPLENPGVRHEPRDASFGCILLLICAATIFGLALFGIVWGFFREYRDYQAVKGQSEYPLSPDAGLSLPAEPRLEQLDRMAGGEQTPDEVERARIETLESYGPTPDDGFIRVPIDRALGYAASKLPHRQERSSEEKKRENGLVDYGAPNSGRLFQEKKP